MGDVIAVQGVPSKIEGTTWQYGDSKVYFAHGKVIGWQRDPAYPLRAKAMTEPAASAANTFTLGSSKGDVRSAQGAPLFETDAVWDYGTSRVYFDEHGRVSGWEEYPLQPLNITR